MPNPPVPAARWHRPPVWFAAAMGVLTLVALAGLVVDDRTIGGGDLAGPARAAAAAPGRGDAGRAGRAGRGDPGRRGPGAAPVPRCAHQARTAASYVDVMSVIGPAAR